MEMATASLSGVSFDEDVLNSDKPVVVYFWAKWCAPCKVLGPIIQELAEKYKEKIKFFKVDIDGNSDLSKRLNVLSLPTVKFFNDGEQTFESVIVERQSVLDSRMGQMLM